MGREKPNLLPKVERILVQLGENIQLARKRRKLTSEQVSQRAGISRATLWAMEKGSASASIGNYLQVLFVLGLEQDLTTVGKDDEFGRKLQDIELLNKRRTSKPKS